MHRRNRVGFTVDFGCSSSRRKTVHRPRKRCQALRRPGEQISCSPRQWQHWTHARPPRIVTLTRVSQPVFFLSDDPLTYLEPGAPGVYHPFASRYFAKLTGIPAPFYRKKCRGRASNYASREKWPSLLNMSRAAVTGGGKGRPMHFPVDLDPLHLIRFSNPTWRQRSQSQAFQPLFTRFSLDRYFWGSATKTCITHATMPETLVLHSWDMCSMQLHDRPLLSFEYRLYQPSISYYHHLRRGHRRGHRRVLSYRFSKFCTAKIKKYRQRWKFVSNSFYSIWEQNPSMFYAFITTFFNT